MLYFHGLRPERLTGRKGWGALTTHAMDSAGGAFFWEVPAGDEVRGGKNHGPKARKGG